MEHHDIRQSGPARMLLPPRPDLEPEDKLAVAIIRQAYHDAIKGNETQRLDALDYFRSPFFVDHCALLDVLPDKLQL